MNATQAATFNRSVYRDFALFALAAVSVGVAVSMVLATAIVLFAGDTTRTAEGPRPHQTAVAHAANASLAPTSIPHAAS